MIVIAFFYLLRAGEYVGNVGAQPDAHPFRLCDVELWIGPHRLDLVNATNDQLLSATRSYLTFTTQKNGVRNEKIGHATTRHPIIDPTAALARRIIHLRAHQAPPTTPLAHYFHVGVEFIVTAKMISVHLKYIATVWGTPFGYNGDDVSSHSLRAGGATALFYAGVSIDQIRLMGRWQSDTVFRTSMPRPSLRSMRWHNECSPMDRSPSLHSLHRERDRTDLI
jgi:hypothetical protein